MEEVRRKFICAAGDDSADDGCLPFYDQAVLLAAASPQTMRRLFPPPAYELPNDVFFEVTGALQLLLGSFAGHRLYRLLVARRRGRDTSVSA